MYNSKLHFTFLSILILSLLTACDLNDTKDDNGTFSLYFRTKIDGTDWAATTSGTGGNLDTSGPTPLIRLHADKSGTNEYFVMFFKPMTNLDSTITGNNLSGVIEYHNIPDTWVSTTGSITIHKAMNNNQHQYNGTFSGTIQHSTNGNTKILSNGEYYIQGTF